MLRFTALIGLLLGTSPLIAEPRHVIGQKDGVSFDYTADLKSDGSLVLRGTYLNTDENFELKVYRNGHVDGSVGSAQVSFDVSEKVRDQAIADLSAGPAIELAQRATTH